ncbi:Ig-like domain-containing protein [Myxococcus xanthus]|nr:Ig-like domain-containing protein [Myxococcus xanthus]NOJ56452.1 Ig-like domain-containing protein [Myxococcus xanthus]QPM80220.1 Ig-like domain-containing protein [Myxococcus xanthus]QVW69284.1 Ig-like domain-containing protein [Myxococcus xanthus DZ2]UEO04589.1 Ig-like domain-containing protein [Myxococcus xanthus DZ2]UYI15200.1 Ig-like domain-containing protein [Myxococcus xanthus]
MNSIRVWAVCLSSLFWACINVPGIEIVPESPDAGPPSQDVTLTLSRAATNGDVDVRVSVAELAPESVELLVDGVPTATLPQPSYELRWSTRDLDEGQYIITARASIGDRVYVSAANTLFVDRTAPWVVTQSPRSGDRDVSVHAPIQAVFSEAVEPSTVNAESIRLLVNQSDITAGVRLSADGMTVTLTPATQIPVDSNVSVTIAPSVTDVAGNALDVTALDWEWAIPRHLHYGGALSAGTVEASNVSKFSFVLDGNGNPVVAFVDGDSPSEHGVYVMRWTGAAWEQLGEVLGASAAESIIMACSLQISPGGEFLVAWSVETSDGTPSVHVRRWSGGGWSAVGAPVTATYLEARFGSFDFVVDSRGGRWLVVHEFIEGNSSSISTWLWDGESWERVKHVLTVNHHLEMASLNLMVDSADRPALFWALHSSRGGGMELHSRRWAETHWVESDWIPSGGGIPIASALDGADRLVLAGSSQDVVAGAGFRPIVGRFVPGGGWQLLGPVIEGMYPGETNATAEVLELDHDGQLVALISEPEIAGGPVNHYVRRWDESSWAPMGTPLLPRPGATPVGPAQFFMTGPEQWVLARIEESAGTPSRRHLYVYRPNN